MYLFNLGFLLTLVLKITVPLLYQSLPISIRSSLQQFSGDLMQGLSFSTYFFLCLIFLVLTVLTRFIDPINFLILLRKVMHQSVNVFFSYKHVRAHVTQGYVV